MEVAALKAWAVYFTKNYAHSLRSFQRIYDDWIPANVFTYSAMLMNYSNCMISNGREDETKDILNEALDACNDYAQAQDISVRMLLNAVKHIELEKKNQSYAKELRPKIASRSKKINKCEPSLPSVKKSERRIYPKRTNLRN